MSEKRPDGYYWVRPPLSDRFIPIYWNGQEFPNAKGIYPQGCMEIGPPCSRDDAKQLQRAREVLEQLVAVVGLTAFKHESQRAVLQEAVDAAMAFLRKTKESGVRL